MNILKLTDEHAIKTMKTHVEHAIDNPEIRVFQILGYLGNFLRNPATLCVISPQIV